MVDAPQRPLVRRDDRPVIGGELVGRHELEPRVHDLAELPRLRVEQPVPPVGQQRHTLVVRHPVVAGPAQDQHVPVLDVVPVNRDGRGHDAVRVVLDGGVHRVRDPHGPVPTQERVPAALRHGTPERAPQLVGEVLLLEHAAQHVVTVRGVVHARARAGQVQAMHPRLHEQRGQVHGRELLQPLPAGPLVVRHRQGRPPVHPQPQLRGLPGVLTELPHETGHPPRVRAGGAHLRLVHASPPSECAAARTRAGTSSCPGHPPRARPRAPGWQA